MLLPFLYVTIEELLIRPALCTADDMEAMVAAVKQAIMHCCLQVRTVQPMRPCIKLQGHCQCTRAGHVRLALLSTLHPVEQ